VINFTGIVAMIAENRPLAQKRLAKSDRPNMFRNFRPNPPAITTALAP
jgi:hypothetical protein